METFGYLAAVLIGVSLGLIGGGGSILTVPVLVYLFGVKGADATAYSLFIVGVTALIGTVSYFRRGEIDLKVAAVFGVPSIVAVYLTRAFLVPAIPERIVGDITRDKGLLLLFALLMVAASFSMIRKGKPKAEGEGGPKPIHLGKVLAEGLVVGTLTGLVGAGGGFLIIPALVVLAGLPMKTAVGTSLLIIAAKSLLGFLGDVQSNASIPWNLILGVTGAAVIGIVVGTAFSKRVSGDKLKPAFGYFVLLMGSYMIVKELFF